MDESLSGVDRNSEARSLVADEGDWKYRKINMFRVFKGFIAQLKPGQDLTKVSLPAELCHPYTMLEVMGYREITNFHFLFDLKNYPDDPLKRFLIALKYFLGTIRQETFEKKPFNSVLGETHIVYSENENGCKTQFIGEQVSHHPPISAFIVRNELEKVECTANISFSIKFGRNISISTAGPLYITSHLFNETYILTKCLPDMAVKNAIGFGPKYIMWEGSIEMKCEKTGYHVKLNFKESKGKINTVNGEIYEGDKEEPIYLINGVCGKEIFYYPPSEENNKTLLVDIRTETLAEPHYLPYNKLDEFSSVHVWRKVNKAIVNDDISKADKFKKVVEQAQRERRKFAEENGLVHKGKYFECDDKFVWTYTGNFDIDNVLNSDVVNEKVTSENEDLEFSPTIESDNKIKYHSDTETQTRQTIIQEDPSTKSEDIDISLVPPKDTSLSDDQDTELSSSTKKKSKKESRSLEKKERKLEKKKAKEEQKLAHSKIKLEKKNNSYRMLNDVIDSGTIRMRNSLKKWKDKYFVLTKGKLIYYKSQADSLKDHCEGIILLDGCDVRVRPSKKEGYCFKIYSLLNYPIYSKQGLKGETIKRAMLPVGADSAILLVHDEQTRNRWIQNIKTAIPDYQKNKVYLASLSGTDSDDDDLDVSKVEESKTEDNDKKPIDLNDILQQIEQLYIIVKRVSKKNKEIMKTLDELKKKESKSNTIEKVDDSKKSIFQDKFFITNIVMFIMLIYFLWSMNSTLSTIINK